MVAGNFLCMEVLKSSPICIWAPPKPAQPPVCSGFEPFICSAGYNWLHGCWTGTLKWSQLATVCPAVVPRQLTLFSSQEESGILKNVQCFTSYIFLPQGTHLIFLSAFLSLPGHGAAGACRWGAPAPGEEVWWAVSRHLPKEGMGSGSPDIRMLLEFCYRLLCGHQQLWKLPSLSSSLLPKPLALQNCCRAWFTKKCSEALGVKYCDKRRHSSSLLHHTF